MRQIPVQTTRDQLNFNGSRRDETGVGTDRIPGVKTESRPEDRWKFQLEVRNGDGTEVHAGAKLKPELLINTEGEQAGPRC